MRFKKGYVSGVIILVCFFTLNVFAINKDSLVVYNTSVVVEGKIRNVVLTDMAGVVCE
jgi:hypothetical protein